MNFQSEFQRKGNRVKEFKYVGNHVYFITICSFQKQIYFTDNDLINYILLQLRKEAKQSLSNIYAYCFMPDHLHLLLIGDKGANLINYIKMFKQKTGYYFKQKHKKNLWQKSFYDHVLRKQTSINDLALYIFDNPVRKGMVNDFRKYPFLGSDIIDVEEAYQLYENRGNIDISLILKNKM